MHGETKDFALDKLIPKNYWQVFLDKHQDSENERKLSVDTLEMRTSRDLRAGQTFYFSLPFFLPLPLFSLPPSRTYIKCPQCASTALDFKRKQGKQEIVSLLIRQK